MKYGKARSRDMIKKRKTVAAAVFAGIAAVLILTVTADASGAYPVYTGNAFSECTVRTVEKEQKMLIAAGVPFGIKAETRGVVVMNLCEVFDGTSKSYPALDAGIKKGDSIVGINGKNINNTGELASALKELESGNVTLDIVRSGKNKSIKFKAGKNTDGEYKLGIWIRDKATGIGTVTFIDPETLRFGGLGHGISMSESGEPVDISGGVTEEVTLSGINPGRPGVPGELKGFFTGRRSGVIEKNTKTGVYGVMHRINGGLENELYPVGGRDTLKPGKAYILTTVDDGGRRMFEAEISDISDNPENKNFTVRITDDELISLTGGIVQGMSGSPVIQDGKLVGAVTHVMIGDPTSGYGIFIDNMLGDIVSEPLREAA